MNANVVLRCGGASRVRADIVALDDDVRGCRLLDDDPREGSESREKLRESIRAATRRTLADRPWLKRSCEICMTASVEVVIFRSGNRNKRRGIHNLYVFHTHLNQFRQELA